MKGTQEPIKFKVEMEFTEEQVVDLNRCFAERAAYLAVTGGQIRIEDMICAAVLTAATLAQKQRKEPAPAATPAQPTTCGDCGWLTNARQTVGDCGAPIPDVIYDPGAILATVAKTRDARFCECFKPKEPTR